MYFFDCVIQYNYYISRGNKFNNETIKTKMS